MALLDDLGAYLVAQGVCVGVGTDLFLAAMPDTPDACVVLYEYGGLPSERRFGSSALIWEHPRVQVVVRGAPQDPAGTRTKAQAVYVALGAVQGQTLGGVFYHSVLPQQAPFPLLPPDDTRRFRIGFNCQVDKDV